jgi:hypothetical protein
MAAASLSRTELYQLVWSEPMIKVAPRFGLSDVGLAKVCKRYNIPRPPVGYWAQKQFGKQPAQTPLPEAAEGLRSIRFLEEERQQLAASVPVVEDRVSDDQLKKLIAFEEEPSNQVAVPEQVAKYHPFVRQTKEAFAGVSAYRGLVSPNWAAEGARLQVQVAKESVPRALRLMDCLIKEFEKRDHKVTFESTERRRTVLFVILGEKFEVRLREKSKMIRVSEAERKTSYERVRYEPNGLLELQLHSDKPSLHLATWVDGARKKLEDQINEILIELIVGVERVRKWRKQQEEYEGQRREAEIKRWKQEDERRKEQQKVQELEEMMGRWEKSDKIRTFVREVRQHVEATKGPIAVGSELGIWLDWALDQADHIDPLGRKSRVEPEADGDHGPQKPR